MKIGILKEIKDAENRVAMTPAGCEIMIAQGHKVFVETRAGEDDFKDSDYRKAGAEIFKTPQKIYKESDMVMHVKEPQEKEFTLLRENQIIFTYLHLAADRKLTSALVKTKSICIAYETIQKKDGSLPLLTPMSEVAGRMSIFQGAKYLEMAHGGQGVLLSGVPGVEPATVVVIGGGIVGMNAAKIACGIGAQVYLLETNLDRIRYLTDIMPANCTPIVSNPDVIRKYIKEADLVIGAVLITGAKAPKLITRPMLKTMKKGAVIVDVAIDQGGCFETSRPTTHDNPTYKVDGIVHYCVANMPGTYAKTSTLALTNATLPYALEIANLGWKKAMQENMEIRLGANVVQGKITYQGVADAFNLKYWPIEELLKN